MTSEFYKFNKWTLILTRRPLIGTLLDNYLAPWRSNAVTRSCTVIQWAWSLRFSSRFFSIKINADNSFKSLRKVNGLNTGYPNASKIHFFTCEHLCWNWFLWAHSQLLEFPEFQPRLVWRNHLRPNWINWCPWFRWRSSRFVCPRDCQSTGYFSCCKKQSQIKYIANGETTSKIFTSADSEFCSCSPTLSAILLAQSSQPSLEQLCYLLVFPPAVFLAPFSQKYLQSIFARIHYIFWLINFHSNKMSDKNAILILEFSNVSQLRSNY